LSLNPNFPAESTVIIAAFAGWNDAAAAATDALNHLLDVWECEEIFELPIDDYYDYSFNRPEISTSPQGVRELSWPGVKIYRVKSDPIPGSIFYLIQGDEPSMRWSGFAKLLLTEIQKYNSNSSTVLLTLGAMLAEVPHTRPVPVNGSSYNPELQAITGYSMSNYEGATGIISVLNFEAELIGIPAASIWAALPHYVGAPPCPKGTLALIRGLEDVLDISIPVLDLVEDARAWQTGVEELAVEDEEVAEYIRSLEESQDTAELPEASGEAIAREFEKYLRRREK